jgi:hypothetical protein
MREVYLGPADVTHAQNLGVHLLCASKSQRLLHLRSEALKYKTQLLLASLGWQNSILWGFQISGLSVEQHAASIPLSPSSPYKFTLEILMIP